VKNPDPSLLVKASLTLNRITSAQQRVNDLKRVGVEQLNKLKETAARRRLTQEDIDSARKDIFG
jgi:hypothetical protein